MVFVYSLAGGFVYSLIGINLAGYMLQDLVIKDGRDHVSKKHNTNFKSLVLVSVGKYMEAGDIRYQVYGFFYDLADSFSALMIVIMRF